MLDQPLSSCIDRAIARLPELCRHAPASATALVSWASALGATGRARDHFDGGRAVIFLLPWWLEQRIRPVPDIQLHERLVDASISAYYLVRLIDNVMDENASEERALLPLLGILHSNFVLAYAALFPPGDPFWSHFHRHWNATCEAALREKALSAISSTEFRDVVAAKKSGIKIALAAVCCRYGRLDLLGPWCEFFDRFSCWQQMANDTFDWVRDLRHGNRTYLLSEGSRQKRARESVAGWMVRRGFAWSIGWLDEEMRGLRGAARQLHSPELVRFLEYRDAEVREHALDLGPKLEEVTRLVDAFEPPGSAGTPSRRGPRGAG